MIERSLVYNKIYNNNRQCIVICSKVHLYDVGEAHISKSLGE